MPHTWPEPNHTCSSLDIQYSSFVLPKLVQSGYVDLTLTPRSATTVPKDQRSRVATAIGILEIGILGAVILGWCIPYRAR
jgi:hypothetical protein